jgi:prepilin peptidase CpaA
MSPDTLQTIPRLVMLAVLAFLLARASISDIRRYIIPNKLCLTIAVCAPFYWLACSGGFGPALWSLVINQLILAGLAFGFFFGLFCLNKMGGGDVKLIAAIALWTPAYSLLQWLLLMSLAGGVLALVFLAANHLFSRKRGFFRIRYGVAIALGGMVFIGEPFLKTFSG